MADEVMWVFIGVLVGVPLGMVCGWLIAQVAAPKSSTVVVERSEQGWLIHER